MQMALEEELVALTRDDGSDTAEVPLVTTALEVAEGPAGSDPPAGGDRPGSEPECGRLFEFAGPHCGRKH